MFAARLASAELLILEDSLVDAAKLLAQLSIVAPDHPGPHFHAGRLYELVHNNTAAIGRYQLAIGVDPGSPFAEKARARLVRMRRAQ